MVTSSNHRCLNYRIKSNRESSVDRNLCGDQQGISQKMRPRWSHEEDKCLINYVENNGPHNWGKIASKLKRTSKSCRLRWTNQLSPDFSYEPFTAKEDKIIIDLVHTIGGEWARIARMLNGRTDNQIKKRWHLRLKKMHGQRARQKLPKRKLSQTTEQKPKPTLGNLYGSLASRPCSISTPLPALISTSAISVGLVSPTASPSVSLPCHTAASISSYLPPASFAPYPAASQNDILASISVAPVLAYFYQIVSWSGDI